MSHALNIMYTVNLWDLGPVTSEELFRLTVLFDKFRYQSEEVLSLIMEKHKPKSFIRSKLLRYFYANS